LNETIFGRLENRRISEKIRIYRSKNVKIQNRNVSLESSIETNWIVDIVGIVQ